jgi:chromosome segregation ATPase
MHWQKSGFGNPADGAHEGQKQMRHQTVLLRMLAAVTGMVAAVAMPAQNSRPPASRTSADSQAGRYREMEEQVELWEKERDKFDVAFTSHLSTADRDGDFCQQGFSRTVNDLRPFLDGQISAQRSYFTEKKKEAEGAASASKTTIASAADTAKQLGTELEAAKRDLAFLEEQKKGLLKSIRDVTTGPSPASGEPASQTAALPKEPAVFSDEGKKLRTSLTALNRAIDLQEQKIESIDGALKNSSEEQRSLLSTISGYQARVGETERWLALIEAQRIYWKSYLDMRAAQVGELCGIDEMGPGHASTRKGTK